MIDFVGGYGYGRVSTDRDSEGETYMRYLAAADSVVEDVMMGRRLVTRFFVSGESMGHRVNRCA